MVDQAFDDVEQAPPQQQRPDQQLTGPQKMPGMCIPPKQEKAKHHENVGCTVEEAIPSGVQFQVGQIGDGIPATEHMMPLEHLVQHDPVEEAAQPKAKQDAGKSGKTWRRLHYVHGHFH